MEVHQVVHHATLKVVLYAVDDDLAPDIDDLAVCHVFLVLVQRLVHPLVHGYPLPEILCCLFRVLTLIVGRGQLHLLDVRHDQLFVIALGLHEQCLDALGVAAIFDPSSSGFRRVGSVEDGDQVLR